MIAPEISIIIVSWNVRAHALQCLKALPAAVDGIPYEVILVDNASADGTVAAVQASFPEVRLVENKHNLLYTAAANQGLALARGRYALLLNPDVIAHPHSIARLWRYAEAHPEAGLLGPRILDATGRDDWRTGRDYPTPWSEFVDWSGLGRWFSFLPILVKNRRLTYDRRHSSPAPLLSGACLLFPPHLPPHLRRLTPNFPMYGEDIDLCRRLECAGLERIFVADSRITHIGGVSSEQMPADAALMAVRAMNRYFQKWEGETAARRHRALLGLTSLVKSAIFCTGAILNARWRRQCTLYRLILKWALDARTDAAIRS